MQWTAGPLVVVGTGTRHDADGFARSHRLQDTEHRTALQSQTIAYRSVCADCRYFSSVSSDLHPKVISSQSCRTSYALRYGITALRPTALPRLVFLPTRVRSASSRLMAVLPGCCVASAGMSR